MSWADAIAEVSDEWVIVLQEFLQEEFGLTPDPKQLKADFEAALQSITGGDAFITKYGERIYQEQWARRLRSIESRVKKGQTHG